MDPDNVPIQKLQTMAQHAGCRVFCAHPKPDFVGEAGTVGYPPLAAPPGRAVPFPVLVPRPAPGLPSLTEDQGLPAHPLAKFGLDPRDLEGDSALGPSSRVPISTAGPAFL